MTLQRLTTTYDGILVVVAVFCFLGCYYAPSSHAFLHHRLSSCSSYSYSYSSHDVVSFSTLIRRRKSGTISSCSSPPASGTTRRLFYENDYSSSSSSFPLRVMTIPVLGPIPGGAPLLVGEDFLLEHPTPLQWKTLDECLHTHQLYLRDATGEKEDIVGIDAAPLVAFMDEKTSQGTFTMEGERIPSKYATIAAIVGISSSSSSSSSSQGRQTITLDTSSATSFMESLQQISSNPTGDKIIPSQSTIRLVGIGRAALTGFHSRLPNSYWQTRDDQLQQQDDGNNGKYDDEYDENRETPLLMAQFRLLYDTDQRSEKARNEGRSRFVSPVHAVNEMSQWAAKLGYMHDDRQRLVRGLHAAKARLNAASMNPMDDVLEDHDGLGSLSSGFVLVETDDDDSQKTRQNFQSDIDTLLHDFTGGDRTTIEGRAGSSSSSFGTSTTTTTSITALDQLLQWENYGLGYTSAAVSKIPPLTRMLMEKLQAYYSPAKQATEEHYYEILSFMAVLSLKHCGTTTTTTTNNNTRNKIDTMQWALKCTNTMERMAWAYEQMKIHRQLLKDASEEASAALRECGEECTDLW